MGAPVDSGVPGRASRVESGRSKADPRRPARAPGMLSHGASSLRRSEWLGCRRQPGRSARQFRFHRAAMEQRLQEVQVAGSRARVLAKDPGPGARTASRSKPASRRKRAQRRRGDGAEANSVRLRGQRSVRRERPTLHRTAPRRPGCRRRRNGATHTRQRCPGPDARSASNGLMPTSIAAWICVERSWGPCRLRPIAAKSRAGVRRVPMRCWSAGELREAQLRSGRRGDELVFGRTPR